MALFFDDLGLGGRSVTLPPLGSLRLLGQACEFMAHSLAFFRVVQSLSGDFDACKGDSASLSSGCYVFLCGFRNRPIIPLPPEFPEACLRRLGGLKRTLFYSLISATHLSSEFSLFRWCSSLLVARIFTFGFLQLQVFPSSSALLLTFQCLFIFEMAKKKSSQNVRNPCMLSPAERELYGWVDAEVFTQSSVLASEHLLEHHHEMRLSQDLALERDYVLEAAGPSDRLPFC
ncbi:hypothetical protein PIB30_094295 [Stylosanthes scabra]|uniref:Uncharacterized protein n=1 Tax=Stylosanthes scabra TaxID=79078 RepID=A0ABU6ZUS0_9FABA|nr:hypothetical protein [Stylosanthes scabra]